MRSVRTAVGSVALGFLVGSGALFAQDQPAAPPPADPQQQSTPANGQWRKADDPAPAQAAQAPAPATPVPPVEGTPAPDAAPRSTMDPNYSQSASPAPYPNQQYPNQQYPNPQYPNPQYPNQPYSNQQYPNQPYPGPGYGNQPPAANYNPGPVPGKLTLKPGTFVTVRLNQGLSSDRNQVGDSFSATLAQPLIVDGVVVADRGQTVGGKVVEAKKAGRVEGVSRLAVQLTDLTLADGQPVPVQTQLFSKNGSTSVGRDVGAVGATTATGAAIGAAADWGRGAAIGAGAGALAGIVGVLVTRGRPTYLYPEQILTFRVEAPVTLSTEAAPHAFRWAGPYDYQRPYAARPPNAGYYGNNSPYPYANPYPYAYGYGYPYYWGPGVGFYWGGGWGRGWGRWR
ncbi:MAG: hypothetical protein ABSF54_08545 [Bryobacteraceae bacterium]